MQNLEKKRLEQKRFERNKELTKSMSILECRRKFDINKQVIQYNLEMQILQCLRLIKGKGKQRNHVEVQTNSYRFLPINVHEEIDYDNLDEKKELYAIRQVVLPPKRKSDDSETDDEAVQGRRKKKTKKQRIRKVLSSDKSYGNSNSNIYYKGGFSQTRTVSNLEGIPEQSIYETEYEEEEEESESEFEKSENEFNTDNIKILVTDDKETKRRKLRETYYRLVKQASTLNEFEQFDLNPSNSGPSSNNPLVEVLEIDLNLAEKSAPMPEGTLFRTIENTLDERLFKEKEWLTLGEHNVRYDFNKIYKLTSYRINQSIYLSMIS